MRVLLLDRRAQVVEGRRRWPPGDDRAPRNSCKPRAEDLHPELLQEADVGGGQLAEVGRRPWRVEARRSRPKPKANPENSSGSMPQLRQHVGVHHAAAAQLQPRAVGALEVELGRRLGEREVGRAQAHVPPRAEVGLGEHVDGAGQVGEGDAPVDHQALELVERRPGAWRSGASLRYARPGMTK